MRRISALAMGLVAVACQPADETPGDRIQPAELGTLFVDRADEWGLDFVHFNGMTGDLLYAEMMGAGCALFDYDGDGDLDAYLVQGSQLTAGSPVFPPASGAVRDRLFRNDLHRTADGALVGGFVDVTEDAEIDSTGYGMGVAVADVDLDGSLDLYVTNLGANRLFMNLGDGRFADQSISAGVDDDGWAVPALFLDYDGDGLPDLYVGNYVEYSPAADRHCFGPAGARDYCGPTAYPPASDRLYRNLGSGRFEDVTRTVGIGRRGRTLGAITSDFDLDGRPDLYVANDGEPNFLWLNRGGRFEDGAPLAGVAVDAEGRPQASMGVVGADLDGDGAEDLLVTHLTGESHALYLAEGDSRFTDRAQSSGVGSASLPMTGFGAAAIDFDGDGWLDLFTANGAVRQLEALVRVGDPYPLAQPKQLFHNLGNSRFEVLPDGIPGQPRIGRGTAWGDVDNDGWTDLLVANNSGPAELLVLRETRPTSWLGVSLSPSGGSVRWQNRLAVGRRDGSYASSSDPRVRIALGDAAAPVVLELEAAGRSLRISDAPSGRYLVLHR